MKITVRAMEERKAKLLLEVADPSVANALRRALVADVPKLAIEEVELHLGPISAEDGKEYASQAPLFDEMIAHRLGLVPLPTDPDLFQFKATCTACGGEGCPSCQVIYSINKRGPAMVTSRDLEPIGDARFRPVEQDVPIVKLGEGQAILAYAYAVLGTGREHAKWQAVNGVGYRFRPVVKLKPKKVEKVDRLVSVCPTKVFAKTNGGVEVAREEACILCMECVRVEPEAVEVSSDPSQVEMGFETDGSLTAGQVLTKALGVLEDRFRGLEQKAAALA